MANRDLTGVWDGHYWQHDKPSAIVAEFSQSADTVAGRMRDLRTDGEYSVFEVAAQAGLQPGADEQIVEALRRMVPDAATGPIRYVTHLPEESTLEGRVNGDRVYFLKRYRGYSFSGYKVGDRLVGSENAAHVVHYEGQVAFDGETIEGTWSIEADPRLGTGRTTGRFRLRRQAAAGSTAAHSQSAQG
jgi:hypothetical protein